MGILDDRSRELLTGPHFAHVSTLLRDGSPHIVPVWVGLEDDRILFFKEEGSLGLRNARRDPRIAISVADTANPYRYCTVRGVVAAERGGEEAISYLHELAVLYTGRRYPEHQLGAGVVLVVEPVRARFEDIGGFD